MKISYKITQNVVNRSQNDFAIFDYWVKRTAHIFFELTNVELNGTLTVDISDEHPYPQCFRTAQPTINLALDDLDHWAQVVYQFAHELCHLIAGYPNIKSPRDGWFEEIICECASRKLLLALNATKKAEAIFSKSFGSYCLNLFASSDKKFFQLTELTNEHSELLSEVRSNHEDRPVFRYVADSIFPIINANDCFWQSIYYLRVFDDQYSFSDNLAFWHDASPEISRSQINQIIKLVQTP